MPSAAHSSSLGASLTAQAVTLRDATLFPFSSDSPWNTAIGSNAVFAGSGNAAYESMMTGTAYVNYNQWTVSVVKATNSDPVVTYTSDSDPTQSPSDGTPSPASFLALSTLRIPASPNIEALDANPPGTDTFTCVIQPNGHTVQEMTGVVTQDDSTHWHSKHASISDVYTDGLNQGRRASNTSSLGGLVRQADIDQGKIAHAISLSVGPLLLGNQSDSSKSGQMQWPAFQVDSDYGTSYKGNVKMGSMFAIPAAVNVTSLGLTPIGLMLAHALQDYGAYVMVRTNNSNVTIMMEYGTTKTDRNNMYADWQTLLPYLQTITNSTPTSVGGGGTPRQPALAPVE